jgi:hypothetical protein
MTVIDISKSDVREIVDHYFSEHQDAIYPLNEYTAYLINSKDSLLIKSFTAANPSTSLTVTKYRTLINDLTVTQLLSARTTLGLTTINQHQDLHYVYFGSKSNLKSIFSSFFPSSFDILFNYLSSKHIKQIGSGAGYCYVLYPSFFSSDFSDFTYQTFDPQNALSTLAAEIKSLKADNEYLIALSDSKDQEIDKLSQKILDLEHKNYLNTQMTWR